MENSVSSGFQKDDDSAYVATRTNFTSKAVMWGPHPFTFS